MQLQTKTGDGNHYGMTDDDGETQESVPASVGSGHIDVSTRHQLQMPQACSAMLKWVNLLHLIVDQHKHYDI